MSASRKHFSERISIISKSLSEDLLSDHAHSDIAHNNMARLLRNGLAVVGFVALEDFLKKRSYECIYELSSSGIEFRNIGESLQKALTYEMIASLIRLQKDKKSPSDKITFIQDESEKIFSTKGSGIFMPSEYAFGYKLSNLSEEDISTIMGNFNIFGPGNNNNKWGELGKIGSRLGLTTLDIKSSFINAKDRRHQAAHDPTCSIPLNDMVQFTTDAFSIAISFDLLISEMIKKTKYDNNFILNGGKISSLDIKLNFIKFDNREWKFIKEGGKRALKKNLDFDEVFRFSQTYISRKGGFLIIYNKDGKIDSWH